MDLPELLIELKPYSIALHAASAIVGMATAVASDIMFSFYSRDKIFDARERRVFEILSRIIWVALALLILTGAAIFFSDPVVYGSSVKFLVKMSIVFILTINGIVLSYWIQPHIARRGFLTSRRELIARRIAFACGALSLTSWSSAFGLGMIDTIPLSYISAMITYVIIILIAITVSLTMESRTFGRNDK